MPRFFSQTPEVSVSEAKQALDDGSALALDVREPEEWTAGHIAGAVHIPMDLLAARYRELPADRRIIAVCRSGHRSDMVTTALNGAGYTVENMVGGMQAWVAFGYPIEPVDGEIV